MDPSELSRATEDKTVETMMPGKGRRSSVAVMSLEREAKIGFYYIFTLRKIEYNFS